MSDLTIARLMHWRYEWVQDLDRDVHTILVDELNADRWR